MAKRSADKGQVPKAAVSQTPQPQATDSQGVVPTGTKGNGSATHQAELDFASLSPAGKAAAAAPTSAAPTGQPAAAPIVVVELVNGVDGVWKKLSNGKRVDLTTKEWRQELARLFTRAPAP